MSIKFFPSGLWEGQEVVAAGDYSGSDWGNGIPESGTRGSFVFEDFSGDYLIVWHDHDNRERRLWTRPSWARSRGCEIKPIVPEPVLSENGKRICACCGEEIDDDVGMIYSPYERGWICDDCLDGNYFLCERCGGYHPREDAIEAYVERFNTEYVCQSCANTEELFFRCEDCDEYFDRRYHDPTYVVDHGYVCGNCSADYYECEECNEFFTEEAITYDDGSYYCPNCMRRRHRDSIKNYSYKPVPKFKLKHKSDQIDTDSSITDLLFGAELEIDKGHDEYKAASEITSVAEGDVYCKHDGSLTDRGIEIVTHPCSLSYHMNELGWDKIVDVANKYGYTSHNAKTCGLHIHVGRRQLEMGSPYDGSVAGKVVLCVYRHWDNLVKFSRRLDSQLHWAERNDIDFDCAYNEASLIDAALETETEGRYQAVNLCNTNTIEFRIFRGTLELNTIMATFQMVSNICRYCQKHTALEVMNSQWSDIAYFADYAELGQYLVTRELAQTSLLNSLPAWEYPTEPERLDVITDNMLREPMPFDSDDMVYLRDERMLNTSNNNTANVFHVGDYVVVVNTNSYDGSADIGRIGRVAIVDPAENRLGVVFRNGRCLHSLQGRLKYDRGYWLKPSHLALYQASLRFRGIDLCLSEPDPDPDPFTTVPTFA